MKDILNIRPATERDLARIIQLNEAAAEWVGSKDPEFFQSFLGEAPFFWVAEAQENIQGFILGLHGRHEYASPNYRWFQKFFLNRDFWYVDRVVVDPALRNSGIGLGIYRAASFARNDLPLAAEVDERNAGSIRFHERLGFYKIGKLQVEDHANVMYVLPNPRK
jgi:predicted GNAT superfamily acetyltransferase